MFGPARIALAGTCVLALAGCGTSPSDAVKAKVQQFAQAARRHDYKTICNQVLAPDLLDRLSGAGVSCEQAVGIGLGSVQDPTVSIGKVTVRGSIATAIVLTVAKNQQASLSTMELTETRAGWRIDSLQSPAGSSG